MKRIAPLCRSAFAVAALASLTAAASLACSSPPSPQPFGAYYAVEKFDVALPTIETTVACDVVISSSDATAEYTCPPMAPVVDGGSAPFPWTGCRSARGPALRWRGVDYAIELSSDQADALRAYMFPKDEPARPGSDESVSVQVSCGGHTEPPQSVKLGQYLEEPG